MAFCGKCGTQVPDNVQFCPGCGAPMGDAQPQQQAYAPQAAPVSDDVQANKGMAVLSYLGPLVFIPLFARKNSPYAQFHAKQGLNLFILWVAYFILNILLGLIKVTKTRYIYGIPYEYTGSPWWVTLITTLLSIGIGVLCIIGIINAAKGRTNELPLIGKIKIF